MSAKGRFEINLAPQQDGATPAFTLVHKGHMSKDSQSLEVDILEGSGSGDLENISGSMVILQDANGHTYELNYEL